MVQTVRGGEGLYDLVYETGAGKFDDPHGGKFWTDTGGSKLCSQTSSIPTFQINQSAPNPLGHDMMQSVNEG